MPRWWSTLTRRSISLFHFLLLLPWICPILPPSFSQLQRQSSLPRLPLLLRQLLQRLLFSYLLCPLMRLLDYFIIPTPLFRISVHATLLTPPTLKPTGCRRRSIGLWAVANSGTTNIFLRLVVMVNGLMAASFLCLLAPMLLFRKHNGAHLSIVLPTDI